MSQELRNKAIVIRDERNKGANTAKRVGETFMQVDDDLQALDKKIDDSTTNNKGVFSTFASLQTAYPNAQNKKDWFAFVGTENPREKHIVKANGANWTPTGEMHNVADVKLGEYAKKVNDEGESVLYVPEGGLKLDTYLSKEELDYVEAQSNFVLSKDSLLKPTNHFDEKTITPNKSLNGNTGLEVDLNTTSISNYILVKNGDKVYINSDRVAVLYDADKNIIQIIKATSNTPNQEDRTINIEIDCDYIRFTIMKDWLDTTYCYINENPFEELENQFDKNKITRNKSLSGGNGEEVSHPSTSISNYISIRKGSKIEFNSDRVIAFYDSDKKFISFVKALDDVPSQDVRLVEITEDFAFFRFTIMNEWINTTYCYVVSPELSYSGVPTTKILYNKKPIDDIFTNNKQEVFVDSRRVLMGGVSLSDYLSRLSYNPSIYSYELRKDITNATILADNTIVAAIGNKVVKYGLDGVETILLEIDSVSDWRCVWHDSKGSAFFSPMNSYGNGTDEANYGLYKYDGIETKKVIQLGNRHSIWGIDEDSEGNIYAGTYSLGVQNSELYKSIDGGETFETIYDWNTKHIHALAVDKSNDALYVSVGDTYAASQNFKSTDKGATFKPIIDVMRRQMTAIQPTDSCRLFGTDHSPLGIVYKSIDDINLTVSLNVGYYSNVFFLRKSDLTGWVYAGFKTDPSASSNLYCSIWVTKDDGETWESIKEIQIPKAGGGFWFASNFKEGNMIVGYKLNNDFQGLGISELAQPLYGIDGITGTIIKPII